MAIDAEAQGPAANTWDDVFPARFNGDRPDVCRHAGSLSSEVAKAMRDASGAHQRVSSTIHGRRPRVVCLAPKHHAQGQKADNRGDNPDLDSFGSRTLRDSVRHLGRA